MRNARHRNLGMARGTAYNVRATRAQAIHLCVNDLRPSVSRQPGERLRRAANASVIKPALSSTTVPGSGTVLD